MNRDHKALAALVLASLVAGPAVLFSAQTANALPAATCTMKAHAGPGTPVIEFTGTGFPPNSKVAIGAAANSGSPTTTKADGTFRYVLPGTAEDVKTAQLTATGTNGSATCVLAATTPNELPNDPQKDPKTEQEDAQSQFRKGFAAGIVDARDDCKKTSPKQGAAAIDPNYEKGYLAGQEAGFNRYCSTQEGATQ
ncbi:hypothetical protein ABT144_21265 [Streptomyces sp. NPDC002039]|uniref:hypothetical protein n=1 Tax=unclassified Streptomyces TaxID=2593676 RepID=UPI00331D89E7